MRQLRVLVVEDEIMLVLLLREVLEDLGHIVVGHAGSHSTAERAAASVKADVAILDINLGSGLIVYSQKMTVAAMQIADIKVWAHRS